MRGASARANPHDQPDGNQIFTDGRPQRRFFLSLSLSFGRLPNRDIFLTSASSCSGKYCPSHLVSESPLNQRVRFLAGAFAGGVVPSIVMEGIGDRGRAEQGFHLLFAHPGLELVGRGLLDQVALVDRLLVQDAAASGGGSQDDDEQELALSEHLHGREWGKSGPMIH